MTIKKIFVLIALAINIHAHAQVHTFEFGLVKSLAKALQQQNEYNQMKLSLRDAKIVEDPITGSTEIRYSKDTVSMSESDKKLVQKFKRLSLETQIKIFKSVSLPVFPLKDSIILVDRKNLLSEDLKINIHPNSFTVLREAIKNDNYSAINLEKISFRGDEIYVTISIDGDGKIYEYGMKMVKGVFTNISILKRSSLQSFE